ncbi:MmgE/PrpD family protein [Streptosporangium sp. NBC_01755]|uniref:MmgE/PrpD family protein n=1 Tax=unclassified Streptosporangium TaxID=2632669 RepID=UPI002DDB84AB|nr:MULTISPECIES: MmgE/PrpD family protein [unclassified Streptosporangium]WSA27701.1 MmgE/PrpD family protein [Streptosporangium sp. NBC_01810]WSD00825.1 MmgE/PrpD family protein [Streptosporangium sp. NBC_01755]
MAEPTLGRQLADFAVDTSYSTLPADVVDSVRKRVLDVIGLCVAAHRLPTSTAIVEYVRDQGGRPQAHVVGGGSAVPAPLAALANGVLAHSLDYDDTHLPSVLHPSASVVPAALAAAELAGASGRETIHAIAIGLEVCVRVGMAGYDREAGNSTFFEHGQHATSICGALGGAVAAAVLLGLPREGVLDALGVAASTASGIIEANRTGGTVKRLHCGWAAQSAVTSAELVRRGFTGPPTVLEGRFGFFQAFLHGRYEASEITSGLGIDWAVPGIFFKPYPANHFVHTAVDAAIGLREQGLDPSRVESLTLGVPAPVIRTIGEPIEGKRTPETGYQAQFSGPYAVAAGLLGGGGLGVGLADFTDELARDPLRRDLMAKVEVVADERATAIFPHQFPAVLRARDTDGREWSQEVLTNRGGPQRPLSADELAAKFRDNAEGRLSAATMDAVTDRVVRLDELDHIGDLLRLVAEPQYATGDGRD